MTKKQVWLLRHGQTDYNVEHRWQGHLPTELNAYGHDEARRLAEHLKREPITSIYTSDQTRAQQTAAPLAAALGLVAVPDERLREIKLGVFEGLTSDEIEVQYPEAYRQWQGDDDDYVLPEGESRREVMRRALAAFRAMTTPAKHTHIAIFTHGGTIRLLLRELFPADATVQQKLRVPNTSITHLQGSMADGWAISELAQTPHLSDS